MRLAINGLFLDQPNTGTGQYTINLLREMARLSPHEIFVLRPRWPGVETLHATSLPDLRDAAMAPGYGEAAGVGRVRMVEVPVPLKGNFGKLWFEQIGIPLAARRVKADLLHVPYLGSPLLCACPVVVTVHDLIMKILPEYRGSPGARLYTSLVCRSARRAAMIIADSRCTERDIAGLLDIAAARIRVVYLGCDRRYRREIDDSTLSATRRKYGLDARFILYVGGLDSRKNVGRLIKAFGAVDGDWELAIAGQPHSDNTVIYPSLDGPLRQSGVAHRVKLLGFVPEDDKQALYAMASLFVYPSLYEGFGLPPLEAMACGTPVVCSNSSSLPEVVGTGGVLVDPHDEAGLAQSMRAVLGNDETARELRRLGRERAQHFSWQRTAVETLAVYDEVLSAATR